MNKALPVGVVELRQEELLTIQGGTPLGYVTYLTGCFAAGFQFGYTQLGPALFG